MAVGRDQVPGALPNTCWVSRSSSRNGSVRISIAGHSFQGRRQGGRCVRSGGRWPAARIPVIVARAFLLRNDSCPCLRYCKQSFVPVAGSGFLVGADLVATCAHVVAAAARTDPYSPEAPVDPVTIDFPTVPGGPA